MSLDDFYIMSIANKKKGNMEIYKKVLVKLFGKELSWSEVKELPRDDQMTLTLKLRDQISIDKSPYDIRKLARAIQDSRSGIGGSAITPYECKFCGSKESWGNTATPGICLKCAENMATKIVLYEMDITKS